MAEIKTGPKLFLLKQKGRFILTFKWMVVDSSCVAEVYYGNFQHCQLRPPGTKLMHDIYNKQTQCFKIFDHAYELYCVMQLNNIIISYVDELDFLFTCYQFFTPCQCCLQPVLLSKKSCTFTTFVHLIHIGQHITVPLSGVNDVKESHR